MVCNINYNTIWAHTGLGPQFYNATFSKFMHHMRTAQGLRNPESGFSIEGGTRRLIAAYFGIYSRLLCV